jgi:hypothetical protein
MDGGGKRSATPLFKTRPMTTTTEIGSLPIPSPPSGGEGG